MVMEGVVNLSGEQMSQCMDDVLWHCAPESCVVLLTGVTPIHLIKRQKKKKKAQY